MILGRFFWILALVIAVTARGPASAYELPGRDDAVLHQAIDAWLDGKGLSALSVIAERARAGNVAARLLLSRIAHLDHSPEVAALPYQERRELFGDTSGSKRFPKRWRKVEVERGNQLAIAMTETANSRLSPEAWLEHAKILLGAGERELLLRNSLVRSRQQPSVLEFMDDIASAADVEQADFWFTRWQEGSSYAALFKALGKNSDWRSEGWTAPPWSDDVETEFRGALAEGRLFAIRVQRLLNLFASSSKHEVTFGDRTYEPVDRLLSIALVRGIKADERPSRAAFERAGQLLVREAERGGFLQPLFDICKQHCSSTLNMCVYSGYIDSYGAWSIAELDTPLESVIPQSRWLASVQARLQLLSRAKRVVEYTFPKLRNTAGIDLGWVPRDACFRELIEEKPGQGDP